MKSKELFTIFEYGVDYGLLLAKEERIRDEWAGAFQGSVFARKFAMPSSPAQPRQIHSDKWFEAKRKSFNNFLHLYLEAFAEEQPTNLKIKNYDSTISKTSD